MKEKINKNSNRKENSYYAIASTIGLSAIALMALFTRSLDNLSYAKEIMADPTKITAKCGDAYGCSLVPVTICDGNSTMFDFSDDVCETIPYWVSNYSR